MHPPESAPPRLHPTPAVVAVIGGLVCMSAVTIDVSMPVLALVARDLGAEPRLAPLIISLYLVAYALGQVPVGMAADRYGRLPVLYGGLGVFLAAGAVTALSQDMGTVLAARFVQGLAGAAGPVLGRAVIRDIASGVRASQLMSVMVTLLGVATLAAPLLGSGLAVLWGWRATFTVSVALALVLLVAVRLVLRETRPLRAGVPAASAPGQLAASVRAFFGSFQCLWGTALLALAFGGYMTVVTGASPILVEVYGLSPGWVGPVFALSAAAYTVGGVASRRWVARFGVRGMLAASVAAFAAATLLLGAITAAGKVPLPLLWTCVSVYLLGIGLLLPNATAVALEPVPQAAGFAAGIVGTAQIGLAALATMLAAGLYDGSAAAMTGAMTAAGALTVLGYLAGRGRTRGP
ncbi:MAG: MFS transporter [Rhodocyclaceae bacterium]|nr:MFS transporter [Rhodocyclaceae bacterium]